VLVDSATEEVPQVRAPHVLRNLVCSKGVEPERPCRW
jgi:hypothetical protein